jgi:hypothetical protein
MAGAMAPTKYISDDGNTYKFRQDASNATAVGNVAATTAVEPPKRYHLRYILAQHPTTFRERRIVVGDPANARWVGGTTTISLPDFDAAMAATTYLIKGRIGERRFG